MSNKKKILCIVLFILMFFHRYAIANGQILVDIPGKVKDVEARVYYIGEFSSYNLEYSPSFQDLSSRGLIFNKDNYQEKEKQDQVSSFIEEKGIGPLESIYSDGQGRISYNPKKNGLYAILYSKKQIGRDIYWYSPSIFIYEGSGIQLTTKVDIIPEKDLEKIDLVKLWFKDDKNKRPGEILVYLYNEGKVVRQAKLNEGNFWRSTWTNLDPGETYAVVEMVPPGYRGEVVEEEGILYIKNTWIKEDSGQGPIGGNEEDPTEDPDKAPDKDSDKDLDIGDDKKKEKLPQTGLLWWPLPIFIIMGFIFLALSFRESDHEK